MLKLPILFDQHLLIQHSLIYVKPIVLYNEYQIVFYIKPNVLCNKHLLELCLTRPTVLFKTYLIYIKPTVPFNQHLLDLH